MDMTFAVLIYLLEKHMETGNMHIEETFDQNRRIQRLRLLTPDAGGHPYRDADGHSSGSAGGHPSENADDHSTWGADTEDTLFLRDGVSAETVELYFSGSGSDPDDHSCCRMRGVGNAVQTAELLNEAWQGLSSWENDLARLILQHAPLEVILSHGRKYLLHEYMLVDRDMNVLYSTPGYGAELAGEEEGSAEGAAHLSAELIQSLLVRKDFHEAAQETEGFYFYSYHSEASLYCENIFHFGQYYARLIARLREGESALPPGEAQLFGVFARYIELFFQNDLRNTDRHQNDLLHQLCRALYAGETPDASLVQMALPPYRWKPDHQYRVIILEVYQQKEWHTQMEIALPFLVRQLEQQWPDSCAVSLGDRILWLVNFTLTDQESFFSRFSVFIRENVCRAGVSGDFSPILLLQSAALEAAAALRLGVRTGETFWYYQFEHYRLDYCLDAVTRELPADRLLHPAVRVLRDWDARRGTELTATLRTYLNCGMNMTRSAQEMYIHRTTFCRRMEQICRLTGISEFSSDLTLELLLSLKLLEI